MQFTAPLPPELTDFSERGTVSERLLHGIELKAFHEVVGTVHRTRRRQRINSSTSTSPGDDLRALVGLLNGVIVIFETSIDNCEIKAEDANTARIFREVSEYRLDTSILGV